MRIKPKYRLSPHYAVITGSVLLAVLSAIMVGAIIQRRAAAENLRGDIEALSANFSIRRDLDVNRLVELEAELDALKTEILDLETALPELGPPYAMYAQSRAITSTTAVEIVSITHLGQTDQPTAAGVLRVDTYSVELSGSVEACLLFIDRVENAPLHIMVVDTISIFPEDQRCLFDLSTIGSQP